MHNMCRGKLEDALELYRRAEAYVPDNIKLKERWILFVIQVFLCKLEGERRHHL
jgi:kinesin family protein 22